MKYAISNHPKPLNETNGMYIKDSRIRQAVAEPGLL